MFSFQFTFPAPTVSDVDHRLLDVTIDGYQYETEVLEPDDTESSIYEADLGSIVSGSLVDVDKAGNRSIPRTFEFEIIDNVPPPQPGPVDLLVVGQA